MQLKFFTIPVFSFNSVSDELNKFLRTVKVLEIKKELVIDSTGSFWTICVTYLPILNGEYSNNTSSNPIKEKVDYKNLLSDIEFDRFCKLRKIRKNLADSDSVPAFAVFTDAELAEISRIEDLTINKIKQIKGIGIKRVEKYGIQVCEIFAGLSSDENETTQRII